MPVLLPIFAFGMALLCAVLSMLLPWGHDLLCLLAALGLVCGVLSGLATGQTLEELRAPVLILCALSLLGWRFGRGGGA